MPSGVSVELDIVMPERISLIECISHDVEQTVDDRRGTVKLNPNHDSERDFVLNISYDGDMSKPFSVIEVYDIDVC